VNFYCTATADETMQKALGPLASRRRFHSSADETRQKALGPLAVLNFGDCTATADETMQKALGPLAVAARHILAALG